MTQGFFCAEIFRLLGEEPATDKQKNAFDKETYNEHRAYPVENWAYCSWQT